MMCKYCNIEMSFGNNNIVKTDNVKVFIANHILHVLVNGFYTSDTAKIKYCPMCGERLVQK